MTNRKKCCRMPACLAYGWMQKCSMACFKCETATSALLLTPYHNAMTTCFESTGLGNSQRSGFSGMTSYRLLNYNSMADGQMHRRTGQNLRPHYVGRRHKKLKTGQTGTSKARHRVCGVSWHDCVSSLSSSMSIMNASRYGDRMFSAYKLSQNAFTSSYRLSTWTTLNNTHNWVSLTMWVIH